MKMLYLGQYAVTLSQHSATKYPIRIVIRRIELAIGIRRSGRSFAGSARRVAVLVLLIAYVMGGSLHAAWEQTINAATPTVSCQAIGQPGSSDALPLNNHCHGCFAADVPIHDTSSAAVASIDFVRTLIVTLRAGLVPAPNIPPPKRLV